MTDPTGATEPPTDIWNTIFDITAVRAGGAAGWEVPLYIPYSFSCPDL